MRLDSLEPRCTPAVATYAAGVLTLPSGVQVSALGGFTAGDVATDGVFTVVGAGVGGGPVVQVFDAGGGLVSSFFAFDESFRGGIQVGIDAGGILVVPAPGSGGGPVLRTFTPSGTLLSSVFVGDPSNRDGVYLGAGESAAAIPPAMIQTGVPLDLSARGVRALSGEPTAGQYQDVRADLSHVSPELTRAYLAAGITIDLTVGGIDQSPTFRGTTLYPDPDGAFSLGFSALVDVTRRSGSQSTVLHELGHAVDLKLLDGASGRADWQAIWSATPWPTSYERDHLDEAWAESFVRHLLGMSQPSAVAAAYFAAVFAANGW